MPLSDVVKYSTEGAPMLIGDPATAQFWNGPKDDGSGIIVEYWGAGVETLPKEFALRKKPGRRQKKLANAEAAGVFESQLLKLLLRLYPKATKDPKLPDYPVYFVDGERVFGIERRFISASSSMLKKLKGDIGNITFDKNRKAAALFFDMEGAGPGLIATDPSTSAMVVAKILTAPDDDDRDLLRALERTQLTKLKPEGRVKLADATVIFDSAFAASDLARDNWGTAALGDGIERALQSTAQGPIRVPDQTPAVGAFFRTKPGSYNYAVVRNDRAGDLTYNALWLWPS